MPLVQTSSTAADLGRDVSPASFLVAEAPESYVEETGGSPARGIVIALAASALIWGAILALIF